MDRDDTKVGPGPGLEVEVVSRPLPPDWLKGCAFVSHVRGVEDTDCDPTTREVEMTARKYTLKAPVSDADWQSRLAQFKDSVRLCSEPAPNDPMVTEIAAEALRLVDKAPDTTMTAICQLLSVTRPDNLRG